LENGVGMAEYDGEVAGVVDNAVLAVRNRFGQRGVEPGLGFGLLVEERCGYALGGRFFEGVDRRGRNLSI
jgi:hypothetical protein